MSTATFDSFLMSRLRKKTREPFKTFAMKAAIDLNDNDAIEACLTLFRHSRHSLSEQRSAATRPDKNPAERAKANERSRLANQRRRENDASRNLERLRVQVRRAEATKLTILAERLPRTRGAIAAVSVPNALPLTEATRAFIKLLADQAIADALHRASGPDGFIVLVPKFVQRIDKVQSELLLLDDMRAFFDLLGTKTVAVFGTTGGDKRRFQQVDFNPDALTPPPAVDIKLANEYERQRIRRFLNTFNNVVEHFFVYLRDAADEHAHFTVLADKLSAMLERGVRRFAAFMLRYQTSDDTNDGLEPHVDPAASLGALILGGTKVPAELPCLHIYPHRDVATVRSDEPLAKGDPVALSYSEGDLAFFDGSFAHKSFVSVKNRMLYSQFHQ